MPRELITAPTVLPVTLTDAKTHLRVVDTDDDAYIDGLIVAATERAESFTERPFITQTWAAHLDRFPGYVVRLPLPPLQSITSITYHDTADAEQTLVASDYYVDNKSNPARVIPVDSWPATYARPNAVTITMVVGYGVAPVDVPQTIRQAILLMIGDMFENREESVIGTTVSALPITAEHLLRPYRLVG